MWKLMQSWESKPDSYESDPDHRFERELVVLLDGFEVQLRETEQQPSNTADLESRRLRVISPRRAGRRDTGARRRGSSR